MFALRLRCAVRLAGVLVAVPAAASVGVLVRFALSRYLESDLYYGQPASVEGESKSGVSEK
jgi:hypothetical protein